MKTNIYIPKKIKIGCRKRDDTYTKKLAYVIYYDHKNVLRKEKSWNSWRDDTIDPIDFDNVPTSGFVLNKKVGGNNRSSWNPRATYVRVYDPRDFEFEISIPNLLYILENCSSIKGKGLEGEFVYAWDGTELVLMPVAAPEYAEIGTFNEIVQNNRQIKTKELIIGASYIDRKNDEYVYMGRFDEYDYNGENRGLAFWFARAYNCSWITGNPENIAFDKRKSLGKNFISCSNDQCSSRYAEFYTKMMSNEYFSPYDPSKDVSTSFTMEELTVKANERSFFRIRSKFGDNIQFTKNEDKYEKYNYGGNGYSWTPRTTESFTLEELFNKFQPIYIDQYLTNGNFYKRIWY